MLFGGWRWEAEIKKKKVKLFKGEKKKKHQKRKKPSGNLKNIFISPFNSPPF